VALFPEWNQDFLKNSIMQYSFVIPGRGVVIQKQYAGQDQDIWWLDFRDIQIKRLLEVQEGSLRNGFSLQDSIVFLVCNEYEATLYQIKNGECTVLDTLETKLQTGFLDIKYQSTNQVIFRIIANQSYEKGNNPLYVFNGDQISKIDVYAELYDVDIDAKGEKIVFSYWESNQRHIAMKSLAKVLAERK
jgi:hypothetical protein